MGYDRVEQIRVGVLGDGLEGSLLEEGLPLCVLSKFECLHECSGHSTPWQLVPEGDYSNAERMLAATSLTPLLVNLQSMTSKPNAGQTCSLVLKFSTTLLTGNFNQFPSP